MACLVLLLLAARGGANRPLLIAAFVLYTVMTTVWVHGQYVEWIENRTPSSTSRWVDAVVLVASVLFAVAGYLTSGVLGALFVALVAGYLWAGLVLVRVRASDRSTRRLGWELLRRDAGGLVAVVAGLVLGAVGLVLLWQGAHPAIGCGLFVVGFFAFPAGVSMLSESATQWVSRMPSRARSGLFWGGVVLLSGAAGLAFVATGSGLVLLAVAALAALVVALASSTLADIAAVLALIAFMGITPRPADLPDRLSPTTDDQTTESVLVALGDSYMSGEGASTFFKGTDQGGGNGCRRSPTAWAAMAGQQLPFEGVDFLACSGARTYHVRLPGEGKNPQPHPQGGEPGTQLEQAAAHAGSYTPALVVLSIGGNDAGFGAIGRMCVAPGDCGENEADWLEGLDQVEASLRLAYREVRRAFPKTPVVVVPYPDPIFDADDEGSEEEAGVRREVRACDQVALTAGERRFIGRFLDELNERIEEAASAPGLDFLYLADMEEVLADAGLQLCDPLNGGRPGLNFIGLRSVSGDPSQRFNPANWTHNSLHPNERGHAAMLRVFQDWLRDADLVEPDGDAPPASTADEEDAATAAPGAGCDVYGALDGEGYRGAGHEDCVSAADAWALSRVGGQGLLVGGVGLAAAAGAWIAGVALFAWRRAVNTG